MTSYETKTGRRFTLASHTLDEWSQVVRERLEKLDCSTEFINAEAAQIRAAKEVALIGRA